MNLASAHAQQNVTILGATGSIGASTLDVIRRHPQRFNVFAVTAHQRWQELLAVCVEFRPAHAVVGSAEAAQALESALRVQGITTMVNYGPGALCAVASDPAVTTVMAAIVGAAGLPASLAAAAAGKRVLLANKEALVMAGALFMDAVQRAGAILLPIDSEHNAIFQCLSPQFARGELTAAGIRRILLTASGGPFRTWSADDLAAVTPAQACAHPNWVMGRKISVDSATLMNKGLEVIEAHWLFGVPASQLEVVVHPQSVIHSMVEYVDGSVLAQMGQPDMRTPIANGLAWPERIAAGVQPLDFTQLQSLSFAAPDVQRFPCLRLAYAALETGGAMPAILNAANEVAVQAFLDEKLSFLGIANLVESVMQRLSNQSIESLAHLLDVDAEAREQAYSYLGKF